MPVDVATGTVRLLLEDAAIPGRIEMVWERLYSTRLLDKARTPLGVGWTSRYFCTLLPTEEGYQFVTPEGDDETFPDPERSVDGGGTIRRLGGYQELFKLNGNYVVQRWDPETAEVWRYCFLPQPSRAVWRLASLEKLQSHGLDLEWDQHERLISVRQRRERRALTLVYGDGDLITDVFLTTARGSRYPVVHYEYDGSGHQVAAHDAAGHADRYAYDMRGMLLREIGKDGALFEYRYDARQRCVKTSGPMHYAAKRLRFVDSVGFTEVTDSYDQVFRYHHLPSGQVTRAIWPDGGESHTAYDEQGRVVALTNQVGAVTRYEYDEYGNRSKVIDPLGNTYHYKFNECHLQTEFKDALGYVAQRTYDSAFRIEYSSDALGGRWQYLHDERGDLVELIDPNGARIRLAFSAECDSQRIEDDDGNRASYHFDDWGRLKRLTRSDGTSLRYTYDVRGSLASCTADDGSTTSFEYDAVCNVVKSVNGAGIATHYRYGSCRRLLGVRDSLGNSRQYGWGTEPNRLESVTNQVGEVYRFVYDSVGRVAAEIGFGGRKLEFARDKSGKCVSVLNANGERVEYRYDLRERLIAKVLPDGRRVDFAYDDNGYLVFAQTPDAVLRYERDAVGRVLKEHQNSNWISYEYDRAGRLTSMASSCGHAQAFHYTNAQALAAISIKGYGDIVYRRDVARRQASRSFPGGLTLSHQYDVCHRLIQQDVWIEGGLPDRWTARGPRVTRRFEYDVNSSLLSVADNVSDSVSYRYDELERVLERTESGNAVETFDYDATGNVRATRRAGVDLTLTYASGNRLISIGPTRYEYDRHGRVITKSTGTSHADTQTWAFTWDALDQLTSVTDASGKKWTYGYDAIGRRVSARGPDQRVTEFVWDRNVVIHELEERRATSTWVHDPYSLTPFAQITRNSLYAVITDNVGSPKELLGMTGRIAWKGRFSLWGQGVDGRGNEVDCPLRFMGQRFDAETGLHYNRFRYYDPEAGRFLSADPIRTIGGWNEYAYARNPINWVDPYGLVPIYRGMTKDADGAPVVPTPENKANPANTLGIRPGEDGMSTNLDPGNIPAHRRPPGFGPGDDPKKNQKNAGMFSIDTDELAQFGLKWEPDHDTHGIIVPTEPVSPEEHNKRLAATKDKWKEMTPEQVEEEKKKQQQQGCGQ